ncbi:hypothetical protein KC669_01765 [Candidatus Dojkabacteria bacterium]|uniref:Uncharacterized protein n=1 Tax=Candidatus Dojkabacteria bacterium TaxID=2099670 RepID=A0A955RL66_9BACT|nr:hypothetical protein [Candidatus Dojkabacteria bacterium]
MTQTVKDKVVKVTVLSAVTIVTFAGNAALIIPNSSVNASVNHSYTREISAYDTNLEDNSKQQDFADKLFKIYSTEGIRSKIDRAKEWKLNSDILEYLDISNVEAIQYIQSGKTFRDIAIERGKSVEEVANIFEDSLRYKLDRKFEEGNISYERYKNLVNNLPSIRENFINGIY